MEPAKVMGLINGCRDVICQFLEVEPAIVYSTIKLIAPADPSKPEDAPIYMIARSAQGNRKPEFGVAHLAGHNSDFSALLGCRDRKNVWPEPFKEPLIKVAGAQESLMRMISTASWGGTRPSQN